MERFVPYIGAYFKQRVFLHSIIILGRAMYSKLNRFGTNKRFKSRSLKEHIHAFRAMKSNKQ